MIGLASALGSVLIPFHSGLWLELQAAGYVAVVWKVLIPFHSGLWLELEAGPR